MSLEPKWLQYAKELQAIAQAGLTYTQDKYERERFQQIQRMSIEIMHEHTEMNQEKIKDLYYREEGYPTPKVDVRAAVFKNDKILMVKEKVDGLWSLPGGWADAKSSLRENVVKEAREEAGAIVTPKRIIAVLDRQRNNLPPSVFGIYKIFVECIYEGGTFQENIETWEADFFGEDELPPLSTGRNTLEQIKMCFTAREKTYIEPIFD